MSSLPRTYSDGTVSSIITPRLICPIKPGRINLAFNLAVKFRENTDEFLS